MLRFDKAITAPGGRGPLTELNKDMQLGKPGLGSGIKKTASQGKDSVFRWGFKFSNSKWPLDGQDTVKNIAAPQIQIDLLFRERCHKAKDGIFD